MGLKLHKFNIGDAIMFGEKKGVVIKAAPNSVTVKYLDGTIKHGPSQLNLLS